MAKLGLPAVGDLVELWFSGYDQYYSGVVKSLEPPNAFNVFLDDGTTWPVDRVNNIWRHTAPQPPSASGPTPDTTAPPSSSMPQPPDPKTDDPSPMEDIDDTRAPLQASTPTHTPSTATGAPADPTSQKTPSSPQPQRRKSGRAFRKSTGGPPSLPARPVNPDADPGPTPSAAPAPPSPGAKSVPPARVTRQRASQDQETPSKASPVRAVRRGRPPASAQKRSAPHTPVVTWNESPDKRRKVVASGDIANGVRPSPIVERVTRSGGRKEEESVEKLSTKAVTAIAVEAALASAKAVFKPLSDQLAALRTELENVSEAARRAADEIPLEASRKRRGKSGSSPVSAAADALQLDLSELLGGGEARIRAYANLSDNEFENFHKLIEDQRKGLKEFDRILQAAKELGKKAEKNAARDARAGRGRSRRG